MLLAVSSAKSDRDRH